MADTDAAKEAFKAYRAELIQRQKTNSRIALPFPIRLLAASSTAFVTGMILGVLHGSETTALRYRAENAHRLPTTSTGWYLYHKSKNYQAAWGGVKEGAKMGGKIAFWTAGFFSVEECFDRWRGTKDFFNTVGASLAVAGAFSVWSELVLHFRFLHPISVFVPRYQLEISSPG